MIQKVFPAEDGAMADVIDFVEEALDRLGCPMKAELQITMCVEEIFINAAHYAYDAPGGETTLSIDSEDGMVSVTLTDSGVPFDPLARELPDITLSAEERGVGGLGILLVRKCMDEVSYERRDDKNIFTMKKHI